MKDMGMSQLGRNEYTTSLVDASNEREIGLETGVKNQFGRS